jgi:hypothetical protein
MAVNINHKADLNGPAVRQIFHVAVRILLTVVC